MIRNMLISVAAFGIPVAFLAGWALIAATRTQEDADPQMLFLYVFMLPLVTVTAWLVAKGPPR